MATRNGGPSEIFEDGSGVLVDPFDNGDIARGLLQALAAQGELSARAQRRVSSHYTWHKTAQAYLSVMEDGVKARHDRGGAISPLDDGKRIADYLRLG